MSDTSNLTIKLGVETSSASKQVSELTKELKSLDKQISSLDTSTGNFTKDMNNLSQKSELVKTKIGGLEEKLKAQNTQLADAEKRLESATQKMQSMGERTKDNAEAWDAQAKRVENAQKNYNNLTRQIGDTERALESAKEELVDINNQWDKMSFEKPIKELDNTISALDKEINSINTSAGTYSKSMENMGTKASLTEAKITALEDKLKLQNNALDSTEKELIEATRSYEELRKSNSATAEEMQKAAERIDDAQNKYDKLSNEILDTEIAIRTTKNSLSELNAEMAKMPYDLAANSLRGFGDVLTTIGDGFTNVSNLTKPLSTALTAGFTGAITTATSFEEAIAKVGATSGATADDMSRLEDKARDIGATTQLSASQGAEALLLLAQAGYSTDKSLQMVDTTVNLAIASGLELAEATSITTSIMAAYGLGVEEATHVTDVLSQTASSSNTNVSLLGEAFTAVAPTAAALGYTVSDTSAVLGLLGNNAIQGSEAGNALKSILASLVSPTENATKVMEEYGISLTTSEGKTKPLLQVVQELQEKLGGLDETQQAEIATTLVGKMQMSKFLAIINGGGEDFNKLTEAISDCDGKTEQMRSTMENTTSGSLKSLMSKIEDLAIEVGNKLLPTFTDIVDKLGEAVSIFGKLDDETQNNIIKWGLLGAVISPITGIIGKVFNSFGSLFNILGNGVETIGNVVSAIQGGSGLAQAMASQSGLVGSIGKLVSAFGPLMTAMTPFLVGGVIAVGVGLTIAGLCTAFKNMTADVEDLADGYDHGAKLIEESNQELANDVKNKYDEIKLDMEEFKRDSKTILADLFDETNTNTSDDLEELKTICGEKLAETKTIVEEYGEGIKKGLELFNTDNVTIFSTDQIQSAATSWMDEVNKNLETSYSTFETTVTKKDAIIAGIMEEDGVTYEEAYATWQERVEQSYNEFYENLIEAQTGYQEDSLGQLQEFLANANVDYSEKMSTITTQLKDQMREQNKVAEDSLVERNITIARLNDEELAELNMTREEALAISELEYEQACEVNEKMMAESVRAAAEIKYAKGEISEAEYKEWCNWSDLTIKNCEDKEAAITRIIESAKDTDSAIWESAMEAMNYALDAGYNEGEVYTTDFWNKLVEYYKGGGTDIERAVDVAMGAVSVDFAEGANNVEESTKRIDDAIGKTAENAHGDLGQIDSDCKTLGSTVDTMSTDIDGALTEVDTSVGKAAEHVHGDLGQIDVDFNNTASNVDTNAKSFSVSTDNMAKAAHDAQKQIDPAFEEIDNASNDMANGVDSSMSTSSDSVDEFANETNQMESTAKYSTATTSTAFSTMEGNISRSTSNASDDCDDLQSSIDSIEGKEENVVVNFLSNGFSTVMSNIRTFASNVISALNLGKDSYVIQPINFGSNYESDDIYGMKDAGVKTISLTSFADDGISAYATKDSTASELIQNSVISYNNSYSTVAGSNNDILNSLTQLLQQNKEPDLYVTFNVNGTNAYLTDEQIRDTAKKLDTYYRIHSRK